jgi:two-component system, OmpR family, alkaline phosphatase synthesis response regulator PhoP
MAQLPERKVIVIVEDTQEIAQLLKETLNTEPTYQAVIVTDSALAVEVIRSVKASLIILDVYLPGISGLDLYDMLQSGPETSHIPVLFITAAHSDPNFRKRNLTSVIGKPFDLDEVMARVSEILEPRSPSADDTSMSATDD